MELTICTLIINELQLKYVVDFLKKLDDNQDNWIATLSLHIWLRLKAESGIPGNFPFCVAFRDKFSPFPKFSNKAKIFYL